MAFLAETLIAAHDSAAEVTIAATLTLVDHLTLRLQLEIGWRSQDVSGHEESDGGRELHLVMIYHAAHTSAYVSSASQSIKRKN
jgi:hypothetical protein